MKKMSSQSVLGAALIEMAYMLPVLCLLFIGMMDLVSYARVKKMNADVSNALAGALYPISVKEAGSDDMISRVLNQISALATPFTPPTITVRFCEWYQDNLYRDYKQTINVGSNIGCDTDTIQCGANATSSAHGAFVQIASCHTFKPLIIGTIFSPFVSDSNAMAGNGGISFPVTAISYIPLTDANQTQLILGLPYGDKFRVPENGSLPITTTTCTGAGCNPVTTTTTTISTTTSTTTTTTTTTTVPACTPPYTANQGKCLINCPVQGIRPDGRCGECPPGGSSGNGPFCESPNKCPTGTTVNPNGADCISDCGRKVCATDYTLDYNTCTCQQKACNSTQERINDVCVDKCGQYQQRDASGTCITCRDPQVWHGGACCADCESSSTTWGGNQGCGCRPKCGSDQYYDTLLKRCLDNP